MAGAPPPPEPVGYLYWWTTSAILLIFTSINVLSIIYRFCSRYTPSRRRSSIVLTDLPKSHAWAGTPSTSLDSPASGTILRTWSYIRATMEKWLFLSAVPRPQFSWDATSRDIPLVEVGSTVIYTVLCLTLSFANVSDQVLLWANQAGWVAAAQIPLIIALASKNNVISFLTGIGYEKLNFLHRSAGRVCLLCSWIHVLGHVYLNGGISARMVSGEIFRWGAVGILAYTLLMVTSIRWVRQRMYEFFLMTHIALAAATIAGFILHWDAMAIWIYPGIGIWAFDRLFRIFRLAILNNLRSPALAFDAHQLPSSATLQMLTPSTLKLTFPAPSLPWAAGHHFYVIVPGMSSLPWEAHPFTACTIPSSGELSFVVRVRDGFTSKMKKSLESFREERGLLNDEEVRMKITAAVEGPYGVAKDLSGYEGVILIAGGSGISFALSHLLQIVEKAKHNGATNSKVRSVRLIWMVKSTLHVDWITPILALHSTQIPPYLNVQIQVYVTRKPADGEPRSRSGSVATWSAPQRPSRSRSSSTWSWATFSGDANRPGNRFRSDSQGTLALEAMKPNSKKAKRSSLASSLRINWDGKDEERAQEDDHRKSDDSRLDDKDEEDTGDDTAEVQDAVVSTFNWSQGFGVPNSATRRSTETESNIEWGSSYSPSKPASSVNTSPTQSLRRPSIPISITDPDVAPLPPHSIAARRPSAPERNIPPLDIAAARRASENPLSRPSSSSARRVSFGGANASPGGSAGKRSLDSPRPAFGSTSPLKPARKLSLADSLGSPTTSRRGSLVAGSIISVSEIPVLSVLAPLPSPLLPIRKDSLPLTPSPLRRISDPYTPLPLKRLDQDKARSRRPSSSGSSRSALGVFTPPVVEEDDNENVEAAIKSTEILGSPFHLDSTRKRSERLHTPRRPSALKRSRQPDEEDEEAEHSEHQTGSEEKSSEEEQLSTPADQIITTSWIRDDSDIGHDPLASRRASKDSVSSKRSLRGSKFAQYSIDQAIEMDLKIQIHDPIDHDVGPQTPGSGRYSIRSLEPERPSLSSVSATNMTTNMSHRLNVPTSVPMSATSSTMSGVFSTLEHTISYHSGRADLEAIITQLKLEIQRGRITVNVCGPGGLLKGTKAVVRKMISVDDAWNGEGVSLEYHAETFGW